MLKEQFIQLLSSYTSDPGKVETLWSEIEKNYSGKKRFYHTLEHLENMLNQLNEVKAHIKDWDAVLFALYYHDAVYDGLRSDNEEKSALLAEERMRTLQVPASIIENCKNHILATKKHTIGADSDTDYFTDADLAILGQDWARYEKYYKNVRKEYSIYPDLVYKPGRKKVLQHFLGMEKIFKTPYFSKKFESQASLNLQAELERWA